MQRSDWRSCLVSDWAACKTMSRPCTGIVLPLNSGIRRRNATWGSCTALAVAFRRIDGNNIEAQIFGVDDSGNVEDFSSFSFEMERKKAKK